MVYHRRPPRRMPHSQHCRSPHSVCAHIGHHQHVATSTGDRCDSFTQPIVRTIATLNECNTRQKVTWVLGSRGSGGAIGAGARIGVGGHDPVGVPGCEAIGVPGWNNESTASSPSVSAASCIASIAASASGASSRTGSGFRRGRPMDRFGSAFASAAARLFASAWGARCISW